MNTITPPVNLKGTFKLKAPLNTLINPNVVYSVSKVSTITSLINDGINVEQFIYKDNGLTTADYIIALEKQISIVTLITEGGSVTDIPADYISYMPQISGKVFINKAFIVNVGYVPSELDISFLVNEFNDLVNTQLGVENEVTIEDISGKLILSNDEYNTYENNRVARISNRDTCRGNLEKALTLLATYKEKMRVLVNKLENI